MDRTAIRAIVIIAIIVAVVFIAHSPIGNWR